jgi:hypothetical protein
MGFVKVPLPLSAIQVHLTESISDFTTFCENERAGTNPNNAINQVIIVELVI